MKIEDLKTEKIIKLFGLQSGCINACSEYYHRPYAEKYIDILGYDRVMEIYNDQKHYFDTKCKVNKGVYTDSEGVTYNSLVEEV